VGPVGITVTGTAANDTLVGSLGNDLLTALGGADTITAGAGDDTVDGGAGNDTIVATIGDGNDVYDGGAGTDTYTLAGTSADATVNLLLGVASSAQTGNDTLANIENVTGGSGNDTLTGNALNNVIVGGAGNDTLSGGTAGTDTLNGGLGDDIYIVDTAFVTVTEAAAAGTDTVRTSLAAYTLGANVENLAYTAAAAFSGTGNALDNAITGGAGADTLNGAGGNDVLTGGAGNDSLIGGAGTDTAVYAGTPLDIRLDSTGTVTTVVSDPSLNQGTDTLTTIEVLRIGGVDYNIIVGTAGNNVPLAGTPANNAIFALAGADTVNAGAGSDIIVGGLGNDILNGEAGDDYFMQVGGTDGRDRVDGGLGVDTYMLFGDATAETFRIYTRAAWLAVGGNVAASLNANTEIVITRNGTNNASVVAELASIEEIKINSLLTTANNGNGVVDGGAATGDTVLVIGDFTTTSLNYSTITIAGAAGNDTVDITGLTSAHRIVFASNGGADTIVGDIRPQDVIGGATAAVGEGRLQGHGLTEAFELGDELAGLVAGLGTSKQNSGPAWVDQASAVALRGGDAIGWLVDGHLLDAPIESHHVGTTMVGASLVRSLELSMHVTPDTAHADAADHAGGGLPAWMLPLSDYSIMPS